MLKIMADYEFKFFQEFDVNDMRMSLMVLGTQDKIIVSAPVTVKFAKVLDYDKKRMGVGFLAEFNLNSIPDGTVPILIYKIKVGDLIVECKKFPLSLYVVR